MGACIKGHARVRTGACEVAYKGMRGCTRGHARAHAREHMRVHTRVCDGKGASSPCTLGTAEITSIQEWVQLMCIADHATQTRAHTPYSVSNAAFACACMRVHGEEGGGGLLMQKSIRKLGRKETSCLPTGVKLLTPFIVPNSPQCIFSTGPRDSHRQIQACIHGYAGTLESHACALFITFQSPAARITSLLLEKLR
eukprot:scaffold2389_cov22-Tisochrysis_lutea.AAC.1